MTFEKSIDSFLYLLKKELMIYRIGVRCWTDIVGSLLVVMGSDEIDDGAWPPGPNVPISVLYISQINDWDWAEKLTMFLQKFDRGKNWMLVIR